MDDSELPATQPVLPSLLKGVVAYVEVRSGHDNRSRGVISELRSLGATISTTLSNDVTHVVFQGGYVSTYKKARQMCHVVAVSWIEASKELGCRAPEEEYPPPGYEKYEDPEAARRIKVFKSMQPDFDNEKDDERLNRILERIKQKGMKRPPSTEDDACHNDKPRKKKNKSISDKKSKGSNLASLSRSLDSFPVEYRSKSLEKRVTDFRNPSEIGGPPKRRRSTGKRVKLFTHCGDVTCVASSETISFQNGAMDYNKQPQKQLDNGDIASTLLAQENPTGTSNKSFDFAVPKAVKLPARHVARQGASAVKQKSANHVVVRTEKKSQTPTGLPVPPEKNGTSLPPPICGDIDGRPVQARPLVFIENIRREKGLPAINNKKIDESSLLVTSARQTRRSSLLAGSLMQIQSVSGRELQPDSCATNPFVSKVLEALSSRKKPQVTLKSPWRRQSGSTVERRQSPRFRAQQKENYSVRKDKSDECDERRSSADVVQTKRTEPRLKIGFASASAHLLKMLKTKPRKMNSPDAVLLDISYGPGKVSECQEKRDSDSDASSFKCNSTPIARDAESLLETLNGALTDGERSDSPILGSRVKHRLLRSVLSSSRTSTNTPCAGVIPLGVTPLGVTPLGVTPLGVTPLGVTPLGVTPLGVTTQSVIDPPSDQSTTTERPRVRKKNEQDVLNECRELVPKENDLETKQRSNGDSTDGLTRSSRKRSRSSRVEKLPTLVCTFLKGSDVKRVMKAVRDLGNFEFEEQVSERTTHLVACGPRRTINMLRAICRGCWVLSDEWVYQSVKAGRWLPEENFELTEFSPMVQQRRTLRQSRSGLAKWDLLSPVGPIFVSPACQPHPSDLKDLILLSGGTIAKSLEKAAVVIRPFTGTTKNFSVKPQVEPVWLLDCIVTGKKLPLH